MADERFSLFNNDSKWLNPTAIATYLIIIGTLIGVFNTGIMAYEAMFPETVEGNTSIEGKVQNKLTEEPIEGVMVSLEDTDDYTFTDAEGNYRLNDTEAGIQVIVFKKAGFRTVEVRHFLAETSKDQPNDLETLKLEDMEDFNLPRVLEAGSVKGRVYSEIDGAYVAGAEVRVNGSSLDFSQDQKAKIRSDFPAKKTSPDGSFEITGLEAGLFELVVTVELNQTQTLKNLELKFYQEVITFYAAPGEETVIDVTVEETDWASLDEPLDHPYTFTNHRSVQTKDLNLDLELNTPDQVAGSELIVNIYKHHTGAFVDGLETTSRTLNFTLNQGVYVIEVMCQDCKVTRAYNTSVAKSTNTTVDVPFGMEPLEDDKADTSGLLVCLIPSIILIVVAGIGAYYAWTRKKFFLAVIGAVAVVPQQSIMLAIPSLSCLTVNLIIGVLAAVLIFRSRSLFDDAPKVDNSMLEAEKARENEDAGDGKKKK